HVAVVNVARVEARGQHEDLGPSEAFAQYVLGRPRYAPELDPGHPIRAEQDSWIERLYAAPRDLESLAEIGIGLEHGDRTLVRFSTNRERRVLPDQILLELPKAMEDLMDEHDRAEVCGVDQQPDRPVAPRDKQRFSPRIGGPLRRDDPQRDFSRGVDTDRLQT